MVSDKLSAIASAVRRCRERNVAMPVDELDAVATVLDGAIDQARNLEANTIPPVAVSGIIDLDHAAALARQCLGGRLSPTEADIRVVAAAALTLIERETTNEVKRARA